MQATINDRANMTANARTAGNISASPSTGVSGTTDYEVLTNKPSINGHELTGNQTGHDLNLANLSDIPSTPVYNLLKIKLWDFATDNNNNIIYGNWDITLHDDINNYDVIILEVASFSEDMNTGNAWNGSAFITLFTNMLNNAYYPNRFNICTYDQRSTNIELKNNRCRVMINSGEFNNGLISVWGVKLGVIV